MSGKPSVRLWAPSESMCRAFVLGAIAAAIFVIDIGVAMAAELEEIVVTARKREESVRDIPVAVTAVSGEQLERYSLMRLEDVAELTPQLSIFRGTAGNAASINIRGIGPTTTSIGIEQSAVVIMDGAYYGQGRIINEGLFDTQQIEILKGPQALFFGKNATAGAINIRTNDPGDETEFIAGVGYEFDAEEYYVEAIASGRINEQLGVRLATRYSKQNSGWIENNAGAATYTTLDANELLTNGNFVFDPLEVPAADSNWPEGKEILTRLTVLWEPNEDLTLRLKAHYNEYESASTSGISELVVCPGDPVGGTPPGFSQRAFAQGLLEPCDKNWKSDENPFPTALADSNPLANVKDGDLFDVYDSYSITGDAEYATDNMTITSVLNYQYLRNRWGGDFDTSASPDVYAAERHSYRAFSAEVRALSQLEGPFNFMIGAFVQTTELNFDQDVIFAGSYYPVAADPTDIYTAYEKVSATDGNTYSIFAQTMFQLAEDWELTAGARYHHETKTSFFEQPFVNPLFQGLFSEGRLDERQKWNDVSPEATLSWNINDNVTAYVAYKQAFKAGGFSISGILGTISGTSRDFLFENEKAKGYEAGVKASLLDNTLQVEFEFFDYDFDDLQIDFFNSDVFALITENAGSAETIGAELQFRWATPVDGLTLNGSLAYNDATYGEFIAPCWSGQGQDEGCVIFNPGEVPKQDLKGFDRNLAPEWMFVLGANWDVLLGDSMKLSLGFNGQWRDDYSTSAVGNPVNVQDSSVILNAALRLGSVDDRWEVAVIGKNLTDKFLILNAIDNPSSGSPPGSATGTLRGDQRVTANRPRSIAVQATVRF